MCAIHHSANNTSSAPPYKSQKQELLRYMEMGERVSVWERKKWWLNSKTMPQLQRYMMANAAIGGRWADGPMGRPSQAGSPRLVRSEKEGKK